MHLAMKLILAAPLSALPSDPTAFGKQASRLHLAMALFLAAPASGLPSLLTALTSQLSPAGAGACASAVPTANAAINAANAIRFMLPPRVTAQESSTTEDFQQSSDRGTRYAVAR